MVLQISQISQAPRWGIVLTAIVVVYTATTLLLMRTTAGGSIATLDHRIAEPREVRIAEPREAAHHVPETRAVAALPAPAAVVTVASTTADEPKTRQAVATRESRREPPPVRPDPPIRRVPVSSPATAEPLPIVESPIAPLLGSPPLPASPRVEPRPVVEVAATLSRPEPSAAPVPRMPPPEAAIQSALSRYQTAYRDLDAGAARAIWPSVDSKALSKAFDRLEQQDLFFDSCRIAVHDVRAVASCQGFARYVPRVGSKAPRDDQRQWEFKLSKVDDIWLIDSVSAR
jgi:hypothetical protein